MNNKIFRILLLLFLSAFILFQPETTIGFDQKQITVIFRYDDYSSKSPSELELKILNAFKNFNIPLTFGVIPYVCSEDGHDSRSQNFIPLSPLKAAILRENVKSGVLEVALHGYSHQTFWIKTKNTYSEFSGRNYGNQFQIITKGKNLLEKILSIQINTFIPPWNSYDINTLRVLEKIGFKTISAGIHGISNEFSHLKFLPETCSLSDIREAVISARKFSENKPIIVILFHPHTFIEIDKKNGELTFQDFIGLLTWITSQKDINVRTIDETTKVIKGLDSQRYMNYTSFVSSPLRRLSPTFLKNSLFPIKVYPSIQTISDIRVKSLLCLTLFYLLTLMTSITIAYLSGFYVFSKLNQLGTIAKYTSIISCLIVTIYVCCDFKLYFKGAILITTLFGTSIGIFASLYKIRKYKLIVGTSNFKNRTHKNEKY